MRKRRTDPCIFVVSDGQGVTCMRVFNAVSVQFANMPYECIQQKNVRTAAAIESIVRRAARLHGVIFYTLVGHKTRNVMQAAAAEYRVPTVDILGPPLAALNAAFMASPNPQPGLLYASEKDRFDRYDAIDFTLKHDDGARPSELKGADVVLVGVSRSSKTSACFYLAYWGIKAANVPIIPGMDPPAELLSLDPERVIGLRVNLSRLLTVREARAANVQREALDKYLDHTGVSRELTRANRLMDKRGWRSIDASYLAVEEIGREVMRLRGLHY